MAGLVACEEEKDTRIYSLTEKGTQKLDAIVNSKVNVSEFLTAYLNLI
jgi:DNA-binding PadR family transcriptional regulator